MEKNRKVAIIVWDMGQIGGIATRAMETKRALDWAGIKNDIIILTDKERPYLIRQARIETRGGSFTIQGVELSVKKKNILKTLNFLDKNYDILFHITACIHDNQTAWLLVYALKKRQVVVISDIYWNDFYPYFDEAKKYIDKIYATNQAVKNYLEKEKGIKSEILIHPFEFNKEFQKKEQKRDVIWASQWRNWKGIKYFVEKGGGINGDLILFGGGREYYNLGGRLPKNAKYLGFKEPVRVIEAYQRGMVAVDLTGQSRKYWGHYNRTTIEPMFWKCVMAANEKLIEPYSFIPKAMVLAVNKDNFVDRINEMMDNKREWEALTERAFKWAINYFDYKKVVEQVVKK